MSELPNDLKYVSSHEWVRKENAEIVTIGITDHAQSLLGDIVFIELPEIGKVLHAGSEAGVIESVKAASDVYAPVEGEVVEVNQELSAQPDKINQSPYEAGWIFKLRVKDMSEVDGLMNKEEYESCVESEA